MGCGPGVRATPSDSVTHARAPDGGPYADWLARAVHATPGRAALVSGERIWTFAELDAEATRMAQRFGELGVREGHRVATLLHNGPTAAIIPHALLRLGATLVPLNWRLSDAEVAWQVSHAAPRALVAESRTASTLGRARAENPGLIVIGSDADAASALGGVARLDVAAKAVLALRTAHDPAHVLAIVHTSGTTGRPKGAMLTVANFWWSAEGSARNLGVRDDDRWLACLPLFHVGGLSIVLRAAVYGITAIVHDGFDEETVNRAIDEEGVTMLSVVAVMLQRMLDARGDRPYPSTLRCVLLGGGPAPRPLLERCAALGVPVVQTYGLTETASQVATISPDDALRKLGSAGRPLHPNELRIVTESGEDAPIDTPGEILVRGPVVMAGYAADPDATARTIVDGWLHTGDIGRLDAEGFLYVLDRRDDLIITGGENVYPAEVEAVLLAHPDVAEAGVYGVSDATWGQRVVAQVLLVDGAVSDSIETALLAHCRSLLAGYKVPSEIRVVAQPLPRTASGKLRRAALRPSVSGTDS